MSTDRVTVIAGGRPFETTTATLVTSGSGYFKALYGPTGQACGHGTGPSASTGRGRKRSRESPNEDEGEGDEERPDVGSAPSLPTAQSREIFVDRDPDLFDEVLSFMRTGKLRSKTSQDAHLLKDLQSEAEYFAFDALKEACKEAEKELTAFLEGISKSDPEPAAKFGSCVVKHGEDCDIEVPEGQVLFITSAILAGKCCVSRYSKTEQEKREKPDNISGCYINTENDESGDFRLGAYAGPKLHLLAHIGLNHIHLDSNQGLNVDFRQELNVCLTGDPQDHQVSLACSSGGDWYIMYWVGDPEAIPGLRLGCSVHNKRKQKRLRATMAAAASSAGADGADGMAAAATMMALAAINGTV